MRLQGIRLALLMALVAVAVGGCIRKTATITSDPPAAKVWLNGVYRGQTPVEIPYNWNWFYDIKLEKSGYEPLTVRERFYAPVRHWVPVDLVTELAPVRSKERQWRHYVLTPKKEL
jgi:hypothetical protein